MFAGTGTVAPALEPSAPAPVPGLPHAAGAVPCRGFVASVLVIFDHGERTVMVPSALKVMSVGPVYMQPGVRVADATVLYWVADFCCAFVDGMPIVDVKAGCVTPAGKDCPEQDTPFESTGLYRRPLVGFDVVICLVKLAWQMRIVSFECAGPSMVSPPENAISPHWLPFRIAGRPSHACLTHDCGTPVSTGSWIS